MKAWETLGEATTADGQLLQLQQRGEEQVVRVGGTVLMTNRSHGSEEAMAEVAFANARVPPKHLLVGGLGLGFTLQAVLDRASKTTEISVSELLQPLVTWNREALGTRAAQALEDPRVKVLVGDVRRCIEKNPDTFDAILLDVDNGPAALTQAGNAALYQTAGLRALHRSLRDGGVLVVWSAGPDDDFVRRLGANGFTEACARRVAARRGGSGSHILFIARKAGTRRPS